MNSPRSSSRPTAGFSLIELMVVLAVTVILVLIVLQVFNLNEKLALVQTRIAEMQQSLRIGQYDMARLVRMAGRGRLPAVQPGSGLPSGIALAVRDNVTGANANLIPGDPTSPKVLDCTDVITVRGVFASEIFEINVVNPGTFRRWDGTHPPGGVTDADQATTDGGELHVCARSPTDKTQILTPFYDLIDEAAANPVKARNEALIVGSFDPAVYTVVQLDPISSTKSSPTCAPGIAGVTLHFKSDTTTLPLAYRTLQPPGAFRIPPTLSHAKFVGILEEYRYYVREERATPGDPASDLVPILSRARFYPGTNTPYQNDNANLTVDIASGIVDVQASFGIDTNADDQVIENPADLANDEWLGNAAGEAPITGSLFYLRLNTLARTERRDRDYQAPILVGAEDRTYGTNCGGAVITDVINGGRTNLMYRRRNLTTNVSLRNLF
ncbi:MAG TPA: PilW family protein [Thermoanaerobaculia bacterium]|nr:PilW family protein [Thermoanaerobaculia bacterium]